MKFSVLLPTRNRLKYLKYAVDSVLAQDYENWEIIISDNDSQEDIHSYIQSLNDPRIKYFRTKTFVSVTENWNNSINHCTGDYVIMLGDDDILLNKYFSTMIQLLQQYNYPNLIYANAYIYTYPGVIPQKPAGTLHSCINYPVFQDSKKPFWLTKELAMRLVQGHLNFNAHFGTNMQYILMKKSVIEKTKIDNQFFYSPYPDVYVMNVMMLETEKVLICPKEMVVIGVTPKSTGNFLVNNNEKGGMDFLNTSKELTSLESLSSIILPSSPSLTSWLIAMETVKIHLKDKHNLKVNYFRYRYLQIESVVKGFFSQTRNKSKADVIELFRLLSLGEKSAFFAPLFIMHFMKRFFPTSIKRLVGNLYDKLFNLSNIKSILFIKEKFSNIYELFEQEENGKLFSKEQIKAMLEANLAGRSIEEICKSNGISQAFLEKWKNQLQSSAPSLDKRDDSLQNKVDALLNSIQNSSVKN